MRIAWKKVGIGLKVALGIAIKLNDAKIIKVKELDTVKTIKEIVESELPAPTAEKPRSLKP